MYRENISRQATEEEFCSIVLSAITETRKKLPTDMSSKLSTVGVVLYCICKGTDGIYVPEDYKDTLDCKVTMDDKALLSSIYDLDEMHQIVSYIVETYSKKYIALDSQYMSDDARMAMFIYHAVISNRRKKPIL